MPGLSQQQKDKLIKIAGPRYNPSTDIVKMSCEMFGTQAQNKRYLRETVNNLVKEARDGKDTFADVPFDFRHHRPKTRFEFPKEWILTPERKQYLDSKRQQQLELDSGLRDAGKLLDGAKLVEKVLSSQQEIPVPEMMEAGGRGKQRLR
jgi:small subunit ribosomal protein S35